MGSKTNFLENKFLNHVLTNTVYTPPITIYIGLFTVAPTEFGGGTEVSTSGTGYVRQSGAFLTAVDGYTYNTNVMSFGPAISAWGEIVAFALFDLVSGGNMLFYGDVTTHKTIDVDDRVEIPFAGLTVTED
jgi:hypothetical protein